ncbi:MAG: hypothetical protein ACXV2I_07910 [Actinomycetes bacterium]
MARTPSSHSPNRQNRAGRADRRVTGRAGQQPSPAWMLTLLNATMLR